MARPRKDDTDRRTETLAFRLTPAERFMIERAAAQAGMSASEYARHQTLRGRIVVKQGRSLDHAAFDELRRLGVNLNQLAKHANAGRYRHDAVSRVCMEVEAILARELDHGS